MDYFAQQRKNFLPRCWVIRGQPEPLLLGSFAPPRSPLRCFKRLPKVSRRALDLAVVWLGYLADMYRVVILEEHLENTEVPVELEAVVDHIEESARIVLRDRSCGLLAADPFA